jgi:hypothetical protein
MKNSRPGMKPIVTDARTLKQIVERLQADGVANDEIQRRIVSVAVVDLDELNEVLRAA